MITTEQLAKIIAVELMMSQPLLSLTDATAEVYASLLDTPEADKALHAIAEAIWQLGYEAAKPHPLSTVEKVAIAQRALNNWDCIAVMHVIEQTERRILQHE